MIYKAIFVDAEDNMNDVLKTQLEMLKERHKAEIVEIRTGDVKAIADYCNEHNIDISGALYICDEEVIDSLYISGIKQQTKRSMLQAYQKALDMLKIIKDSGK